MKAGLQNSYNSICAAARLIRRFYGNLYGWTITLFFLWQALFVFAVTHDWLSAESFKEGIQQALTASLIIAVHVVVALNTVAFLMELSPTIAPISRIPELTHAEQAYAKNAYQVFLMGLVTASFFGGALALTILLGSLQFVSKLSWATLLRVNEMGSILIFSIFLLADYLGYTACKIASANKRCKATSACEVITSSMEELKLLILAVDLPGFFGLIFIYLLSHYCYPEQIQYYYWHGFVAGAIGLHVAFSQTALALIAARHERPENPTSIELGNAGKQANPIAGD